MEPVTSARGLAGTDSRAGGEAAEKRTDLLKYGRHQPTGPSTRVLIVCIIQVVVSTQLLERVLAAQIRWVSNNDIKTVRSTKSLGKVDSPDESGHTSRLKNVVS